MSDHHGTDTPYEDLLDRAVSAIRDTDLGHQGWALNQPRTNKQLNEQAKEFLKELFAKGEDDRDPIQKEKVLHGFWLKKLPEIAFLLCDMRHILGISLRGV